MSASRELDVVEQQRRGAPGAVGPDVVGRFGVSLEQVEQVARHVHLADALHGHAVLEQLAVDAEGEVAGCSVGVAAEEALDLDDAAALRRDVGRAAVPGRDHHVGRAGAGGRRLEASSVVDANEVGLEDAILEDGPGAGRETFAVELLAGDPADDEGVIDDRQAAGGDALAELAGQAAPLLVDGRAAEGGQEGAQESTHHPVLEEQGIATARRGAAAHPELAALQDLPGHPVDVGEIGAVAGAVEGVALGQPTPFVLQRHHAAATEAGALLVAGEAVGAHHRLLGEAVPDVHGDRAHRHLGLERDHGLLERFDLGAPVRRVHMHPAHVELIEVLVGLAHLLELGQPPMGILFEEAGGVDGLLEEGLDGLGTGVGGAVARVAAIDQDRGAYRQGAGLLQLLDASVSLGDVGGGAAGDPGGHLVGPQAGGQLHDLLADVDEIAHPTPPTDSLPTRTVGMPWLTGTPWPSLPHVQPPSSITLSLPIMSMAARASGPLPMMFTSLTGRVSLPSSMRYPCFM